MFLYSTIKFLCMTVLWDFSIINNGKLNSLCIQVFIPSFSFLPVWIHIKWIFALPSLSIFQHLFNFSLYLSYFLWVSSSIFSFSLIHSLATSFLILVLIYLISISHSLLWIFPFNSIYNFSSCFILLSIFSMHFKITDTFFSDNATPDGIYCSVYCLSFVVVNSSGT